MTSQARAPKGTECSTTFLYLYIYILQEMILNKREMIAEGIVCEIFTLYYLFKSCRGANRRYTAGALFFI